MNRLVTAEEMKELANHPDARWIEGSSGLRHLSIPANVLDRDAKPLGHPTDPEFRRFPSVIVLPDNGFGKAPYDE